jgi:1-acyl-sn-glycerol-3-phosphate acyltransferase
MHQIILQRHQDVKPATDPRHAHLGTFSIPGYTRIVDTKPSQSQSPFPYPRRRPVRYLLRKLSRLAFALLTDFHVLGLENLPQSGPLIVVANHFHFADPAAIIGTLPWPMDFLAGFHLIDAPAVTTWLPKAWGAYTVRRGAASRQAMRASIAVLAQNGILGIFPEGGSWAAVLRPARPGTAYLAARSGAQLLPLGLDGLVDIFPHLRRGRRAQVTVRIGKPFGPLLAPGHGPQRRQRLEKIGDEIMEQIAELLPPERRGVYSSDPAIRAAAREAAVYPYHDLN